MGYDNIQKRETSWKVWELRRIQRLRQGYVMGYDNVEKRQDSWERPPCKGSSCRICSRHHKPDKHMCVDPNNNFSSSESCISSHTRLLPLGEWYQGNTFKTLVLDPLRPLHLPFLSNAHVSLVFCPLFLSCMIARSGNKTNPLSPILAHKNSS